MFEQVFKNIDDILHKDAGCSSELDYVEQTSWILFLKYLDDLEKDRKTQAELAGKSYDEIIQKQFRWSVWAAPKDKDGKIDHHKALTGDDLRDFVDQKLFPYLKKFRVDASSADTLEYKIGEIFSELKNKIQSGYSMREIINRIDALRFRTHAEKHEMSHLYEGKIQNMGNAGRNGGEYYTPRPLIKTIIKIVDPELGNKIYDGASGSAGFLCEAFEYLKEKYKKRSVKEDTILQTKTFYGKEKKSLAYVIGIMNLILHGIDAPNIIHTNTLAENLSDIQDKDRVDIILANPPFGGSERPEVQQNFPIKTSETASLFMQHFIKKLKAGGKAGVVIKNTFLSNTDNASIAIRKLLLESCNLHSILELPSGVFSGATVKTVVLFFEKGTSTKKIWYYQLNLNRNLGKKNPLNLNDLNDFVDLFKSKKSSVNSWTVKVSDLNENTLDLSPKNPNQINEESTSNPKDLIKYIKKLSDTRKDLYDYNFDLFKSEKYEYKPLSEIVEFQRGLTYSKSDEIDFSTNVVLRSNNVSLNTNKLDFTELKYIKQNVVIPDNKKVKKGALLICTANGSKIHLGKVALIDKDYDFAFGGFMGQIIPGSLVDSKFLFYMMTSERYKRFIAQLTDGANINNLKFSDLGLFTMPVPNISTQKRIVKILDDAFGMIDQSLESYQKEISSLLELRKCLIMQYAENES